MTPSSTGRFCSLFLICVEVYFRVSVCNYACLIRSLLMHMLLLATLLFLQVATEADLGFADAYINGYFSFADHREGLLNLLLVKN